MSYISSQTPVFLTTPCKITFKMNCLCAYCYIEYKKNIILYDEMISKRKKKKDAKKITKSAKKI